MRNADFRKCRQIFSSWLLLARVTLVTLGLTLTQAVKSREELLARPVDALLLEQHNIFRQEEKAANILKMHWNDSAAAAAERWARGCDFRHEMAGTFGENLYYGSANPKEEKETLLAGLERWHDEKRGWRYTSEACSTACHYTQMVWSSTNSVGCAYHRCQQLNIFGRKADNVLFLVCYYYPRGNWVGEFPFQMGAPCSSCGSGICQEGLCVEMTSYHSYHGNEVRSGAEWRWQYDSDSNHQDRDSSSSSSSYHHHHHAAAGTGYDHLRQRHDDHSASLQREHGAQHVSHSSARLGALQHNVTRVEAHHTAEEHDVRRGADGSYGSSYRSASYYRASSQQAWEGEATSGARETILRDLESYSPSRTLGKELEANAPQALYAAPPPEPYDGRTRDVISHVMSDDVWSQRRVETGHSRRSPLDILRAETHWCRDRLPSCPAWAKQCDKSKAVLMACPRSCGQCGQLQQDSARQTNELPDPDARQTALRSRPGDEQEKGAGDRRAHPQPAGWEGQRPARVTAGSGQLLRSVGRPPADPRPHHNDWTTTDPNPRRAEDRPNRGREGGGTRDKPGKARLTDEQRQRRHQQMLERRLQRQKEAEEKRRHREDRRRQKEEKRRLREERRVARGPQQQLWIHPKFRTADKRAQKLAAYLRRNAVNGELCEDDPKYAKSCSQWVARGFCTSNELLRNIYCKLSCGMCS